MRRLIFGALCALAGCVSAPQPAPSLRDPKAFISSAVVFDPVRFAGRWYVAASGTPGCAGAAQDWRFDGTAYALQGIDCSGKAPAHLAGRAVLTGPGARFSPDTAFGRAPVWLLWVDQDYRIAVLGTPGGSFGMIVTRELPPRADLMAAAREVLAFNGYDPNRIGR